MQTTTSRPAAAAPSGLAGRARWDAFVAHARHTLAHEDRTRAEAVALLRARLASLGSRHPDLVTGPMLSRLAVDLAPAFARPGRAPLTVADLAGASAARAA